MPPVRIETRDQQSTYITSHARWRTLQTTGEPVAATAVSEATDPDGLRFIQELNARRAIPPQAPVVAGWGAVLVLVVLYARDWITAITAAAIIAAIYRTIARRDDIRRSLEVQFDLDHDARAGFDRMKSVLSQLNDAQGFWWITAHAAVNDPRYHAGADEVQRRLPCKVLSGLPAGIRANIQVPCIRAGGDGLYFFPDRALLVTADRFAPLEYAHIKVAASVARVVEATTVPSDAQTVGKTWRFVCLDGSRDLRFSGNVLLPICRYEEVRLTSDTGRVVLQWSRDGAGNLLAAGIGHRTRTCPTVSRYSTALRRND